MLLTYLVYGIVFSVSLYVLSKLFAKKLADSDNWVAIILEKTLQVPARTGRRIFKFLHNYIRKPITWYYDKYSPLTGSRRVMREGISEAIFTDIVYVVLFGSLIATIIWIGMKVILN